MAFYKKSVKRFHRYGIPALYMHSGQAKNIMLTEKLADIIASNIPSIKKGFPVFGCMKNIFCKQKNFYSAIIGIGHGYDKITNLQLVEGRFFTSRDIAQHLPYCILNTSSKAELFGSVSAINQSICIGNATLKVIGVIEESGYARNSLYISHTFYKNLFPQKAEQVSSIIFEIAPNAKEKKIEALIRSYLTQRLQYMPDDVKALYITSPAQRSNLFKALFMALKGFIWLISLCFLLTGIVGVSSMMLISVKKRVKEIAIRKVMGASSMEIISSFVSETICINLVSGMIGMGIGFGLLSLVNTCFTSIISEYNIEALTVDLPIVLCAQALLIITGSMAAMLPAKRALQIRPVEALNPD